MNKNKGFTLIELLVVIAIIGILASVVLASLSSARDKGKDAAVKSQLASMKAQAELFYSVGETYAALCTTAASANGLGGLLTAAKDSAGVVNGTNTVVTDIATAGFWDTVTCHSDADNWVVEAPMSTSASTTASVMYCVDSTGTSKLKSGAAAAANIGANALSC